MRNIEEKALNTLGAMVRQVKISANKNTDSQTAYAVYDLYDYWPDIPDGTFLNEGKIVSHSNHVLYKVNKGQGHAKQSTWTPDTAVSLFTPIPKSGEDGTIDNPIEWVNGMESEEGKYYIDDGVKYLCIESSGTGLWAKPKDLPRYFKQV